MKYVEVDLGSVILNIMVSTVDPTLPPVASQLFKGEQLDGQQMDLVLHNLFVLTKKEMSVLVFPQVMTIKTIEMYLKQVNETRKKGVKPVKDGRLHMFVVHQAYHYGLFCCQWRDGADHWEACLLDLFGYFVDDDVVKFLKIIEVLNWGGGKEIELKRKRNSPTIDYLEISCSEDEPMKLMGCEDPSTRKKGKNWFRYIAHYIPN